MKAGHVLSKCRYCDEKPYGRYAHFCERHRSTAIRKIIRHMIDIGIWSEKYYYSDISVIQKALNKKLVSEDFKTYFKHNY